MTNSEAQEWEKGWWGNCGNTLGEELKQIMYALKMGLKIIPTDKTSYNIDLQGKSVIDVGGGPVSLLLKCINAGKMTVIDPLKFPEWVYRRYVDCGIAVGQIKAEELNEEGYDEVWIYNCLQHAENPEKVIDRMKRAGKLIRIFEWIDTPPNVGHPNTLTEQKLNQWLRGEGKVEIFTKENNLKGVVGISDFIATICRGEGKMYYGLFPAGDR